MKISLKRIAAVLMCTCTVMALWTGCSDSGGTPSTAAPVAAPNATSAPAGSTPDAAKPADPTATPAAPAAGATGMPIVQDKIELKIMAMKANFQKEWAEVEMWKDYEALTNIHVVWETVSPETLKEKRNIKLASNDLPDAFMRCGFPPTDVESYAMQKMFVQLDDMIAQYGPNIQQAFKDYPDVPGGITMSDGGIYSLPYIVAADSPNINKYFINQVMLEKAGAAMPTTTDELYTMLTKIKDVDFNGNGKADEIAISGTQIEDLDFMLRGAWGLGTRGSATQVDIDPATKAVRFVPTQPGYKEMLQYLNKLYTEKLLDQDIFTMDYTKLSAKGEEGRIASFSAVNCAYMGTAYQDNYKGLDVALKGPGGEQLWASCSSPLGGIGAFVITNQNKYPVETLRWVDYLYSDEGRRMYFMGKEGVTYEKTADGGYAFLPLITKNPDGLSYEQAQGAYIPWGGGNNPSIADNKYFKGPAMLPVAAQAAANMVPFCPERRWAAFTFAKEDAETMVTLASDISTYLKESRAQFVTGQKSFDQWDAYVAQYEKIGLKDYMDIYGRTAPRYEG